MLEIILNDSSLCFEIKDLKQHYFSYICNECRLRACTRPSRGHVIFRLDRSLLFYGVFWVVTHRKKEIGWKKADIHSIRQVLCMHIIYMVEDHKPKAQHQRRLNHVMKEMVRKEVIKLIDASIVYPICDSKWIIPIHCVPKKGVTTTVRNKKNDLIPTRIGTGCIIHIDYRKLNDANM